MAVGFLRGVISGGFLAAAGAGAVSVAISLPEMIQLDPAPVAVAVADNAIVTPVPKTEPAPEIASSEPTGSDAETGPAQQADATITQPAVPQPQPVAPQPQIVAVAPEVTAPASGDATLPEIAADAPIVVGDAARVAGDTNAGSDVVADTAPSLPKASPQVAAAPEALAAPDASDIPQINVASGDAPATPVASTLDTIPEADAVADAQTGTPLPKTAGVEVAAAPDALIAPAATDGDVTIAPETGAPATGGLASLPDNPARDADVSVDTSSPAPQVAQAQDVAPIEEEIVTETAQAATDSAVENDVVASLPQATPTEGEGTEPTPEVSQNSVRPSIGKPASTLGQLGKGVTVRRLPAIGSDGDSTEPTQAALPGNTGGRALNDFAVSVDAPVDASRIAVILIDDLRGPLGPSVVETLPFPVTFAVDASAKGASDVMKAYREKGFEVMVLADLPDGAQPTDIEVALGAMLNAVPESVAVLEDRTASLQSNRNVTRQVTEYLGRTGHGLVLQPKGLNAAADNATRAGVPAATVFRDLASDDVSPGSVRRVMDQAAFRARQDGSVVMLGRLDADTLSSLMLWGLEDRDASVALVPISGVLAQDAG